MREVASRGKEICTSTEDDGKCPVCHGTGWEFIEETPYPAVRRCKYCDALRGAMVASKKALAAIPEARSLPDFNWSLYGVDIEHDKEIVNKFVESYPEWEKEGFGLYITSKTRGSGKTFLASAIGGELINRYALTVRFESASDLLEISRQKRDDGADPLEDLITCRLLILDDLGQKNTGRDWLADVLFRIVDKRYRNKRTIIVTSNVPVMELDLDDRIVDRLYRMTAPVKLPEVCIRAREANTQRRELFKRLGIS